jgi:aryl-alcohol dehydrogenase-like predicted oxidoreductase
MPLITPTRHISTEPRGQRALELGVTFWDTSDMYGFRRRHLTLTPEQLKSLTDAIPPDQVAGERYEASGMAGVNL